MQRYRHISRHQDCTFGKAEKWILWHFESVDNQYMFVYQNHSDSTGKEKDVETGYGYFGARYMDHELMIMWLSVDPMVDKYPAISSYAYCAWNPVKLIDPNGAKIWIKGSDGIEYQYIRGKLYNKDGSAYEGNDEFVLRVQNDLNILKEKGMRKEIESLEISDYKHIIKLYGANNTTDPGKENKEKISNGVGCGTTIKYNPNLTETEGWERPAVVGLAHEMQHAYEMDKGIYNSTLAPCKITELSFSPKPGASKKTFRIPESNIIIVYYTTVVRSKPIERGEYSAIQAANRVYSALGGTEPRRTINGFL